MTRTLRILATVSLLPSALIFLLFLVWAWQTTQWAFFSGENGLQNADISQHPAVTEGRLSEKAVSDQLALIKARIAFVVVAGTIGWFAMFAGARHITNHIKEVPVAIKGGLLLGIAAAVFFPYWQQLALIPAATTVLLFLAWYKNAPNKEF